MTCHLERLRYLIEKAYTEHPTSCGGSFGELLCWEIHVNGKTFIWLAEKWGISLPTLGELIWDHCKRLEDEPKVCHQGRQEHPEKPPQNAKSSSASKNAAAR